METKIEWTRIKNDVNGNGRYVCHFLWLNTREEKNADYDTLTTSQKYAIAVKRANKIGGSEISHESLRWRNCVSVV